jgi:hypothetical protein
MSREKLIQLVNDRADEFEAINGAGRASFAPESVLAFVLEARLGERSRYSGMVFGIGRPRKIVNRPR